MLSRVQIIVIVTSALIVLTGFAAATQWLAHIFGGQAALGHPLFIAGDASIYAPWRVMDWSKKWAHAYPRPFAIADLIIAAAAVRRKGHG